MKRRRGDFSENAQNSKNKYINTNILASVNDILNSYDDKFVLSSIYEDILSPVIEEAVARKEKVEDLPKIDDFIKRPNPEDLLKFPVKDTGYYYPTPTLIVDNDGDYEYQKQAQKADKEAIVRQYNHNSGPVQTIPLRQTQYGVRMRKGINRLMSSIPAWQSALQLLATSLFILVLPGVVQFG